MMLLIMSVFLYTLDNNKKKVQHNFSVMRMMMIMMLFYIYTLKKQILVLQNILFCIFFTHPLSQTIVYLEILGTRKHSAMTVNDHPTVNNKMGFIKSTSVFHHQNEYFKLIYTSTNITL
jgi:membrane glycosyltransferase